MCERYPAREARRPQRYAARLRVGVVNNHGNGEEPGRVERGKCREPPGRENNVGINTEKLEDGTNDAGCRLECVKNVQNARVATDLPGGRWPILDLVFKERDAVERLRADVEEVRVDELFFFGDVFERLCNGNEGIKVSPASSACKNYLHIFVILPPFTNWPSFSK